VPDEQSLVGRAQQGDKEAFAQLYESHFDKIYRYTVLRIGNNAEAEDITQQVFLKALEGIPSFKWKGTPFSAWLFRIAHNLVVDQMRRGKKRTSMPLDEALVGGASNTQLAVEKSLDIEELVLATGQLTQAQREVISLRFAGELSVAETARVMGRTAGAVKALQHSAVVALRKALSAGEDNE